MNFIVFFVIYFLIHSLCSLEKLPKSFRVVFFYSIFVFFVILLIQSLNTLKQIPESLHVVFSVIINWPIINFRLFTAITSICLIYWLQPNATCLIFYIINLYVILGVLRLFLTIFHYLTFDFERYVFSIWITLLISILSPLNFFILFGARIFIVVFFHTIGDIRRFTYIELSFVSFSSVNDSRPLWS